MPECVADLYHDSIFILLLYCPFPLLVFAYSFVHVNVQSCHTTTTTTSNCSRHIYYSTVPCFAWGGCCWNIIICYALLCSARQCCCSFKALVWPLFLQVQRTFSTSSCCCCEKMLLFMTRMIILIISIQYCERVGIVLGSCVLGVVTSSSSSNSLDRLFAFMLVLVVADPAPERYDHDHVHDLCVCLSFDEGRILV